MPRGDHCELICELEGSYADCRTPAIDQDSAFRWAAACHELLEDGRIDVLEHAVRHLRPAFPDISYLTTLVEWFDAVPRHLPRLHVFSDDPAAEIQVLRRSYCDAVLLCFCARNGTLGVPLNLAHQWLGRLPASLVYIKDFRDLAGGGGYPSLAPDRASSVAALRRLAADLGGKRIYTLGSSLGGYAALYYGLELGAAAVLSLGGETDLSLPFKQRLGPVSQLYRTILDQSPDYTINLCDRYASAARRPHLLLAYSAGHASDREQAGRMKSLPDTELIAVEGYAQHNVMDPLIRRGEFLPLLNRLLSLA